MDQVEGNVEVKHTAALAGLVAMTPLLDREAS